MKDYNHESSRAFVSSCNLSPYASGSLDGLTFAVKDLIDIKGETTGGGNPSWLRTHPPASAHAPCVEQLLAAGGTCKGKTVTDELAFSLIGENHFYGTPLNPKAPAHVPGGSSSGSASAVACGLVDFALGTDTGGSVRVPASNCGVYGFRPSHGIISLAGVMPFAPSFDTVGVLASKMDVLAKVVLTLTGNKHASSNQLKNIYLLDDILAICDNEIQQTCSPIIKKISSKKITLSDIVEESIDYKSLLEAYTTLQNSEVWSSLGAWITHENPEFGPVSKSNFYDLAAKAERTSIQACVQFKERFASALNAFLNKGNIVCFPTTPALAPKLGVMTASSKVRSAGLYYPRALAMDAISGLSRAPQISLPVGVCNGVPIGLSFMAAYDHDNFLCEQIGAIVSELMK